MLTIAAIAGLIVLAAIVLASCSAPKRANRSPVGETFPTVRGQGLDKKAWTIPADLGGRPAILLVGYVQNAQFDIDRWMVGLLQMEVRTPFLELPTIESPFWRLFAKPLDNGMRSGIPEENWPSVVTVYQDAAMITKLTGAENPRNARVVLLDREGRIAWFHDRGFSPTVLQELKAKADELEAGREP